MINIYDSKATSFNNNGLCALDPIIKSAKITEELNGQFILDIELIKDDKEKYKYLKEFSIIKANGQLFRLYNLANIQDNVITIKASLEHIYKDIDADFIEDNRAVNTTVDEALRKVILDNRFTVLLSNMTKTATAYFVKKKPFEAIKTILARWGGELIRDNFNIGIVSKLGKETGISIEYAKNITGFEQTLDYSNIVTRMMPVGKDGINILEESKWLESPRINNYFKTFSSEVKFENIEDSVHLKQEALKLWGTIDIPKVNYKINFIELQKTEEYKELYKNAKSLELGDTVIIKHKIFNVNLTARVIKIVRDGLTNKILEIELGQFRDNIFNKFNNMDFSIENMDAELKESKKDLYTKITKTDEKILFEAARLDGEISGTKAEFEITAGEIRTNLIDTKNNLEAQISVQAGYIGQRVTSADFESYKIQAANSINQKVSGSEYNGATIASLINQTYKSINMDAVNINLTGYVTFNSLSTAGSTTINGANIATGTIQASKISAGTMHGVNLSGQNLECSGTMTFKAFFASQPSVIKFDNNGMGTIGEFKYWADKFWTDKSLNVGGDLSCSRLYVGGVEITATGTIAKFG